MSPVVVGDVDTSHHRCAPLSSSLHVVVALVDVAPHCRRVVCLRFTLSRLLTLHPTVDGTSVITSRLRRNSLTLRPDVFTSPIRRTSRLRRNSLTLRPDVFMSSISRTSRLRRNSLTLHPDVFMSSISCTSRLRRCNSLTLRPDVFMSSTSRTSRLRRCNSLTLRLAVFMSAIGRTSRLRRCNSLTLRPRCLHVRYRSYFTPSSL